MIFVYEILCKKYFNYLNGIFFVLFIFEDIEFCENRFIFVFINVNLFFFKISFNEVYFFIVYLIYFSKGCFKKKLYFFS